MSYIIDNYQWIILIGISFSALLATIIGILLKRKKQPKFRVHHISMSQVTKSKHPASSPDQCKVSIRSRIINVGNYQTETRIIFKIKFNCKDDNGKKIITEDHNYLGTGIEPHKGLTVCRSLSPYKNAVDWKKAKVIILAKYNKTSGREVKRRIGCKRFTR